MSSSLSDRVRSFFDGSSLSRYLIVGVGTSLLDFTLFNVLSVLIGVPAILSNAISTIVTVCVSYFINRAFVFRAERPTWSSFFSFAGLTLFTGLVLQSAIIAGVLALLGAFAPSLGPGLTHPIAKTLSMGLGAACNYLGYRWIFSRTDGGGSSARGTKTREGDLT